MVTTLFSDEIVNPTDLRKNQKHWFDLATKSPVSIAYGKYNLAIFNREKIADLIKANYYLELAIKLCTAVYRKEKKVDVFPWTEYLDSTDQLEFARDFVQCLDLTLATGDWGEVDNIIDDWKATAETLSNKKVMEALVSKKRTKSDYVELK